MPEAVTVTAADIARLTGYGRAAVSNWRRRHEDFPQPVGGTASSPLFALADVEAWLAAQGKSVEVPDEERLWQRIRSVTDDLQLGAVVADLGAFLAEGTRPATHADLADATQSLAKRLGASDTLEFLVDRYVEAHARRVTSTPRETADLMAELADVDGRAVLDPSCGIGGLLLAAAEHGAGRVLGQERDEPAGTIARSRLALRGVDVDTASGDSLRADGFPGNRVDAVLCDPPFGDRAWGYDELTSDPRWTYGLPPRGESELAWIQHALWHLEPGGRAVILMPSAAAGRRSGRRIRSQLVRAGALRAVIELPGAFSTASAAPPHLWVLRRPAAGDPLPSHVLMMNAAALDPDGVHAAVTERWRAFGERPDVRDESGLSQAVPLVDLLDDMVDLSSSYHVPQHVAGGLDYSAARDRFAELLAALGDATAALTPLTGGAADLPMTTVSELIQSGAVSVRQTPIKMDADDGDLPMLTAQDVSSGRAASARTADGPGIVVLRRGDVLVPLAARQMDVLVVESDGVAAGPQLQVFRPDPDRCDPYFLACFLHAAALARTSSTASRTDVRRVAIPRLPLPDQRPYGVAFRRLQTLSAAIRELAGAGATLVGLGFEGLGGASLRPSDR